MVRQGALIVTESDSEEVNNFAGLPGDSFSAANTPGLKVSRQVKLAQRVMDFPVVKFFLKLSGISISHFLLQLIIERLGGSI